MRRAKINPVQFPLRRVLLMTVPALVVGIGFGYLRQQRSAADQRSKDLNFEVLSELGPSVCKMEAAIKANEKTVAFNTFWQDVHVPAHHLVGVLSDLDRAASTKFQLAKNSVEKDLSTLGPGLPASTERLGRELGPALVAVGLPEPKACA